tara:strand:- start:246 stop:632 length:387 start_codon:yes stop_codon:yes gene_type:complete
MKLNFKGYISSRKLNDGNFIPQKVQNLVIRNACEDKNFNFNLSATEYGMKGCYLVLNKILKDLKKNKYDGIAFYSIDQLPSDIKKTKIIFNSIISSKKKIYFSLENILVNNKKNINSILNIIKLKKSF